MSTITKEITTTTDHTLEGFFNLPPNSTVIKKIEKETELVNAPEYDEKDDEIEFAIQEVYDKAMVMYEILLEEIEEGGDPRYKARTSEVANQSLNTALSAAAHKARMKEHKDKLNANLRTSGPKTINNNVFVGDRNELLRNLRENNESVIEGEVVSSSDKE